MNSFQKIPSKYRDAFYVCVIIMGVAQGSVLAAYTSIGEPVPPIVTALGAALSYVSAAIGLVAQQNVVEYGESETPPRRVDTDDV